MTSILEKLMAEIDEKAMEAYEEQLEKQKVTFIENNKEHLIKARKISIFNKRLDDMIKEINTIQEAIGKKKVLERYQYGFNAQKIVGIMSTIAYSGENKLLFCVKYNVPSSLLDSFQSSVGQFPYADKNMIYHAGVKGDMTNLVLSIKEFLHANDILIPEGYFDYMTQTWFNEKYAKEEAKASIGITEEN